MTILDHILLAALIIGVPAEALWRSVAQRSRPRPQLGDKLLRSLQLIVVLLALLWFIWVREDRSLAWLGLGAPLSMGGLIGLGIAVTLLGLLGIGTVARKAQGEQRIADAAADMMPSTAEERRLFVAFAFAAGIGWELLYRGYLLWALSPVLGTAGAVVVAAIAYALGHGSRDAKSLVGSVISAFLFTIGYVLTGSLWWLILLHIGLPIIGMAAMQRVQPART